MMGARNINRPKQVQILPRKSFFWKRIEFSWFGMLKNVLDKISVGCIKESVADSTTEKKKIDNYKTWMKIPFPLCGWSGKAGKAL